MQFNATCVRAAKHEGCCHSPAMPGCRMSQTPSHPRPHQKHIVFRMCALRTRVHARFPPCERNHKKPIAPAPGSCVRTTNRLGTVSRGILRCNLVSSPHWNPCRCQGPKASWQREPTSSANGGNMKKGKGTLGTHNFDLVGGLEHFLFFHILGMIIPIE